MNKCLETNTGHVVITGGNPCLYNFKEVIDILDYHGIIVDVETQGSILPDWLNKLDLVVISPKAPSSKQPDVYENIKDWLFNECIVPVAIKIPVFNEEDIEFAKQYYQLVEKYNVKLYINVGNSNTAEDGDISKRVLQDYKNLIDKICNSKMKKVYIMPQLHTLVWGNRQGV